MFVDMNTFRKTNRKTFVHQVGRGVWLGDCAKAYLEDGSLSLAYCMRGQAGREADARGYRSWNSMLLLMQKKVRGRKVGIL
jgi:hypothetical protein